MVRATSCRTSCRPCSCWLSLQLGLAIIAEGSLSFLGLGVPPPAPSWGGMLTDGRKHLSDGWWLPTMPGIALSLIVLAAEHHG